MISSIKKHFLPLAFLIISSIIIHHVWFTNLSTITWGDWHYTFDERGVEELQSWLSLWQSANGMGMLNFGLSFYPFISLGSLLVNLGVSGNLSLRLILLWPIAFFTPLSMYFLTYYISKSQIGALISAIVFTYNTSMIITRSAPLTIHMAFTLTPLFLLFYLKSLKNRKITDILLTTLLGYIISFWEFRIFYVVTGSTLLLTVYLILTGNSRSVKKIFFDFFLFFLIVVLVLLLNSYMLLGMHFVNTLTNNQIFDQPLFGAWYIKLSKILTSFHFVWTGGELIPWKIQPIPLRFFLIPVIVVSGLTLSKDKKFPLFFALLTLTGIFLVKMTIFPFPNVYQWLFDNVPGFNAFRESGKFGIYTLIGYPILTGYTVKYLAENYFSTLKKRLISIMLISTIGILYLYNAKPVFTGELKSLFVPRHIPRDYLVTKEFILSQQEFFRTLWLPIISRWAIYTDNHPRVGFNDTADSNWKNFFAKNNSLNRQEINYLFDNASIKYIFIPLEDTESDDNFFEYLGKREDFIKRVRNAVYLKKINIGTQDIQVYENSNFKTHLYLTGEKESLNENITYQKVNYVFINPSNYQINLRKVFSPIYLNFTDNFHPDWKLKVGQFNWFKVITNKNYFLSEKVHFKNVAGLNSFYLDPDSICSNYTCQKNSDGSYDIDLTLYFRPQSYVYLGGIISLTVLIGIISLLFFSYLKK